MSNNRVFVIGVGMTKFEKPGSREGWDYPAMARESGTKALEDAGIALRLRSSRPTSATVYGESTSGQRAVYGLGMTGIPVINVNNNCSTGSTALFLAAQAVRGRPRRLRAGDRIREDAARLAGGRATQDREQPMRRHMQAMAELCEFAFPPAPWMFGAAGVEHMQRTASTTEHFAKIGEKNHRHSVNNPYAQFQDEYTLEEIKAAKMIYAPAELTRLQCSPTSDGSGAAILASEAFVDKHGLAAQAIEIVGQAMVTDLASHLHRQQRHHHRRRRHDPNRRAKGLRAGRDRPRRHRRDRTARLLLGQRITHLRGARPRSRGRGRQTRRQRRHHLRRHAGWSTRPAA